MRPDPMTTDQKREFWQSLNPTARAFFLAIRERFGTYSLITPTPANRNGGKP